MISTVLVSVHSISAVEQSGPVRSECCPRTSVSRNDAVVGTSQLVLYCDSPGGPGPGPGVPPGPPAVQAGVHEGLHSPQHRGAGQSILVVWCHNPSLRGTPESRPAMALLPSEP